MEELLNDAIKSISRIISLLPIIETSDVLISNSGNEILSPKHVGQKAFSAMYLIDLNTQLNHLNQMLDSGYNFKDDQKANIIEMYQYLSQNRDAVITKLRQLAGGQFVSLDRGDSINIENVITDKLKEVAASANKIEKLYS